MNNVPFLSRKPMCFLWLLLLLGAGFLAISPISAAPETIRMGFHWNMFSGVERNDAKVSLRLWADIFAKEMGLQYTTATEIYEDQEEMLQLLVEDKLDVASVAPWDYLRSPLRDSFEPVLNSSLGKGIVNRRFLLVHKDSGISSLAQLKGRSLLVDNYGLSQTILCWLETELSKHGLPRAETFFSKIDFQQSASKVVHPVFFRKVDACICEESSLETLQEMNPQIGIRTKILAESPPLPGGFVLIRKNLDPEKRKAFLNSALNLDNHVKGQQILTLFKIQKLVPFSPTTLDNLRGILTAWESLSGKR